MKRRARWGARPRPHGLVAAAALVLSELALLGFAAMGSNRRITTA